MSGVEIQQKVFEDIYDVSNREQWEFHDTSNSVIRYLRDRRIRIGIDHVMKVSKSSPQDWSALVVCGGVGGEGTLLANLGFRSVTVSDFSQNALEICKLRDPRLKTIALNAEALDVPDHSYDLVLVQDGLHHLPRPVLGYTEMLRVARRAVVVIEPHAGIAGTLLGTTWEKHGDEVNYVFRWDQRLLREAALSYLLDSSCYIKAIRLWDHNSIIARVVRGFGSGRAGVIVSKLIYRAMNLPFWWLGNNMVGVVVKGGNGPGK